MQGRRPPRWMISEIWCTRCGDACRLQPPQWGWASARGLAKMKAGKLKSRWSGRPASYDMMSVGKAKRNQAEGNKCQVIYMQVFVLSCTTATKYTSFNKYKLDCEENSPAFLAKILVSSTLHGLYSIYWQCHSVRHLLTRGQANAACSKTVAGYDDSP